MMAEKCKECGCKCKSCILSKEQHGDMHLHVEIENLKQRLVERDNHIVTMETQFLNEAEKFPNGELASMKEELSVWQEKYTRLHDAHKRVQKVNQNLEDKLLRIVDKCETEKSAFTKDIATLSHRLADANYTIHRLTQDNEKYRNDVNLAIQLLQCKPSNFVGQKYEALPSEVQAKVRTYIAQKKRSNDATPDVKSITVPISTFPPTAMVYNVTKPSVDKHSDDDTDEAKPPVDIVSAAIMAKVLEDREKERIFGKHCDTCTCHRSILMIDTETQTNSTDVSSSTECTVKYGQNMDKHNDNNLKDNENNSSHKESLNSMVHVTYHEINENLSNKVQYQSNCIKISNCQQFCAKEKLIGRNGKIIDTLKEEGRVSFNAKSTLNKKNSSRRNDSQYQCGIQNNNDETLKYTMSQNVNEAYSKVKPEKGKQTKLSKKCELQADGKYNGNSWNKYEKVSSNCNHVVLEKPKNHFVAKEQSHIDIINDRLWKNEWTKRKSQKNGNEDKEKVNSDIEIDVINDRVWKNDRSIQDARHPAQLTLIEVKNVDNGTHQNDAGQIEVATSPSFSSDSIVISTSDPSSSSSDVVQSIGTRLHNNGNNAKVSVQHRISGPRNCLVRVTPGSKNILLDNAGHYKTVLYTSGSNKPDTALVHSKKLSRSESERSISTSSEESSPMLLHENHQLQRVAEWVQSSVHMDNSGVNYTELKSKQNIMDKSPSLLYLNEPQMKFKTEEKMREKIQKRSDDFEENKTKDAEKNSSVYVNDNETGKDKDLISFDVPIEEEKALPKCFKKCDSVDLNYEVKITKEMEETYLKLAASLDPVALSLSSTDNTDITIEKYRKDHKKLQKSHDKMGSKV